jgi:hypothetical protein
MAKKGRLTHRHWFGLSLLTIILAGIIAGIITFTILGSPKIIDSNSEQPVPKGETSQFTDLKCEDPRKYANPELGCICKEDYKTSTNFRGTFCIEKGRRFSYWPD